MNGDILKNFQKIIDSWDGLYFFSIIFLWVTTIIILFSVIYKFAEHKESRSEKSNVKTKNHFVETFSMALVIIVIFNIFQARVCTYSADYSDRLIAVIYGCVLATTGTVLHIWSKFTIGRFWSNQIEIVEDHKIITTGSYAIVRHPMYSSLILWLVGLSIMFFNYVAILITVFLFVPMVKMRADAEDRLIKEVDAAAFGVYSRSVKQLLPRFEGNLSTVLRLVVIALLAFSLFEMNMELSRFWILFFAHLLTGAMMRIPKVSFSYINKSFIMLFIFIGTIFCRPLFYLYYLVLLFDIIGLFTDCPCMIIYTKYNRCPCIDLVKGCIIKKK